MTRMRRRAARAARRLTTLTPAAWRCWRRSAVPRRGSNPVCVSRAGLILQALDGPSRRMVSVWTRALVPLAWLWCSLPIFLNPACRRDYPIMARAMNTREQSTASLTEEINSAMRTFTLAFALIALSVASFGLFATPAHAQSLCDYFPHDCQGANGNGQIGQGGHGTNGQVGQGGH
jgi:hypothetical protein